MKRIAWFAALIAASALTSAQFSTGFEAPTYTGSSGGTTLTGQDGWYLPAAGGVDFQVYTYAGNSPGVAANPTGGTQFAAGIAATTPARAQHDMDFSSADVWSFSYDILGMYTGQLPTANNLGSFSAQDSATTQSFIALNVWDDVATAASWSAQYNVFDSAGTALTGQSAGAAWTNLTPNHWYRQETQVNFSTHQITKVAITDLTTMVTTTFNPTDWYLQGGASSALPRPTGFRMFSGAAGNLMAFDNLVVPEPGTLAVLGIGLLAALRRRRTKA